MMMRATSLLVAVSIGSLLAGCVAGPAGSGFQVDDDGGGAFSGHAGMDWTEEQLRTMVGGQVCGGVAPRNFNLRILSGSWLFSGTC